MQRLQNEAQQQKVNKADENCEMKHQLYGQLLFIFRNWEKHKNKL